MNGTHASALYGKLGQGEFALLITLGGFTPAAITFASSKSNLRLIDGYPQVRQVKWHKHVPRASFSQGALYETGSALSFFQIRTYAEEFLAALEGKASEIIPPDEEETERISSDVEDQTRDFVIKQLSKALKGLPLEEFIKHLLEKMAYRVRYTRTNEPSIDLIAHKDNLGFEPPIIKVQVKSSDGKITDKDANHAWRQDCRLPQQISRHAVRRNATVLLPSTPCSENGSLPNRSRW